MVVLLTGLTAVGLAAAPASALATSDGDALAWIARMHHATRALSYEGTIVYRNGEWTESVRLLHRSAALGESDRLIALTGEPREIVRDEQTVTCVLPRERTVVVAKRHLENSAAGEGVPGTETLARNYRLSSHEGERVAGRPTQLVVLQPLDAYRFGYRLSLDRDTGLLLKSELISHFGGSLELIMFADIEVSTTIADARLQSESTREGFAWNRSGDASPASSNPTQRGWNVGWLPPGFALTLSTHQPRTPTPGQVEHLVYSDGLGSVSIFVEPADADGLKGMAKIGATSSFGLRLEGHQITVIGEVPGRTAERIARSVRSR